MRKLTDNDLANIVGTTVEGYHVENVRIKRGNCTDTDHYGIMLGRNKSGNYVTWQWHLLPDETVSVYWGHYFMENKQAAIRDFENRDMDCSTNCYKVTITETLKLTVKVEAEDSLQAEQMVSDNWNEGKYILDVDNFVGVEFDAISDET